MNAPVSFLLPAPQLSSPASQNSQSLILGEKEQNKLIDCDWQVLIWGIRLAFTFLMILQVLNGLRSPKGVRCSEIFVLI